MPIAPLLVLLIIIAGLWSALQVVVVARFPQQLSNSFQSLRLPLAWSRKNDSKQHLDTHDGFGDGQRAIPQALFSSRLATSLGWFWIVISWDCSKASPASKQALTTARRGSSTKRTRLSALKRLTSDFYTTGALLTIIAFLVVPLYLTWTLYTIVAVDRPSEGHNSGSSSQVIEAIYDHAPAIPAGFLIPGLTVPLRDAPSLFLAGLLAIVWHEAGHAVTAMWLSHIDVTSVAFVLVFAFPGAYVALDAKALDALPSSVAKLRVVTAGIWHNVCLCAIIWLSFNRGLLQRDASIYGKIGFTDLNNQGVIVQLVAGDSPLSDLLAPGQIITHLDDIELHDSASYHHWDRYLLQARTPAQQSSYGNMGYCVDEDMWDAQRSTCCLNRPSDGKATGAQPSRESGRVTLSGSEHQVCYVGVVHSPDSKSDDGHCFDPSDLLHYTRCTESCGHSGQLCIRSASWESLLRLTVYNLETESSKVLFYRGDKRPLWLDVKVGRFRAAWQWLQAVPVDIETFWLYVSSISLSLAMFNLLPLPRLDGSEILDILLASRMAQDSLPLSRDSKGRASDFGTLESRYHSRIERVLDRLVSTAQALLLKHSDTANRKAREYLMKRSVQVTVAVLIGLNMIATVSRQLAG